MFIIKRYEVQKNEVYQMRIRIDATTIRTAVKVIRKSIYTTVAVP